MTAAIAQREQVPAIPGAAHKSVQRASRRTYRRLILPWLYIAPISTVHLCMVIIPAAFGLYYSLTRWPGIGPAKFIGLEPVMHFHA